MAADNTDFLRFSAWSIKDVITRKLSEDTKFTDQVYEGSNLATMIDLFSYMAQCMIYSLNNAASESMFSDTQYYENMNRLVKLIGYNPKGFIPANAEFTIYDNTEYVDGADDNDELVIPRYSAVNTGKVDSNGNPVYYSFKTDCVLGANDSYSTTGQKNKTYAALLYNGLWKLYPTVFTASGSKYETFVLDGIESNIDKQKYAANGFIDVYVQRANTSQLIQYSSLNEEIFLNTEQRYSGDGITIYSNTANDRYFSVRLNENKVYEIKFGNNDNGQTLLAGDKLYIFYMDSNGSNSELNIGDVPEGTQIIPATQAVGISTDLLKNMLLGKAGTVASNITSSKNYIEKSLQALANYTITNTTTASSGAVEETVDDIRENAPNYCKIGNRLVTKSDYAYYVKNRFKNDILDVKVQNNCEYIASFFGWLYNIGCNGVLIDYGVRSSRDPSYYISDAKLAKQDYQFADPADGNNVYLWIKTQNSSDIFKKTLDEDLAGIKDLTHETVYLPPVTRYFDICAAQPKRCIDYFQNEAKFDPQNESYLEITVSDNVLYANSQIKIQVNNIIVDYFKEQNVSLGQTIDNSALLNSIYAINGVQRVRTVFNPSDPEAYALRYIDGIAFATWSGSIVDRGDDLVVSNSSITLEDFQFPELYHTTLLDKIKVIKKSFGNASTIQY